MDGMGKLQSNVLQKESEIQMGLGLGQMKGKGRSVNGSMCQTPSNQFGQKKHFFLLPITCGDH